MVPLSTEDFPYTLSYVTELLRVDERALMGYVQALGLSPRRDERTGALIFTHRDLDLLKQSLELQRQGKDLAAVAAQLRVAPPAESLPSGGAYAVEATRSPKAATVPSVNKGGAMSTMGRENLSMIVEAVSQAKEGILKDLARLLDDKLAGLDEVVVELIRFKSENDSLKEKLQRAQEDAEHLRAEINKFKPVQFGFYRKAP